MRISCSLTFHVNFKPLIIKIGCELDILCYIFWNSKIWRATFALFLVFYIFLSQFYPIWMKFLSKFRENVGLQAYRLGSVLNRSWTGLRTTVFSGLSQKNWEDRDCWSAWTGYSPVRFSVPFRSYKPDLEALYTRNKCFCRAALFVITTSLHWGALIHEGQHHHRGLAVQMLDQGWYIWQDSS